MPFLTQVTSGVVQIGQRFVIGGVEKSGKSTFMANAPRCLGIPFEMGLDKINVAKTPLITKWDDLIALLDEIKAACKAQRFAYKTLGFDTATQVERLIHNKVIDTDPDFLDPKKKIKREDLNMEVVHGGYGKGYAIANQYFATLLDYCDLFAKNAGLNIIFTCHVFPSRVVDPASGEYDTWDLLLHSPKNNKTFGKREMITQWADFIGFMHEPYYVSKAEKGQTVLKATSANQGRVLAVDRSPSWVAGNRYDLRGVLNIPAPPVNPNQPYRDGWNTLAHAIYATKGIDVYNRDVY